jgi:4-hydroxybenzoate polyprenyltransferase
VSETDAAGSNRIAVLLELVRFEHSVFALPYAFIGAIYGAATIAFAVPAIYPAPAPQPTPWVTLANWPTWTALAWVTVAMVGARAFAFTVPAGLIKAGELWLFAAVTLAAYGIAVWSLAPVTHWLWPVPLAMFLVYPYIKRFSPLAHFWLGACLGLGAVGGWAAVGASLGDPAPWVFGAAVAVWTAGFDIIYATQDHECDVRDGVHSVPADYGIARGLVVTRACHVLAFILLLLGGWLVGASWWYYASVVAAGILLAYENAIVKADDLSRVNAAFFTVNGFVAVIVLAGALLDRAFG